MDGAWEPPTRPTRPSSRRRSAGTRSTGAAGWIRRGRRPRGGLRDRLDGAREHRAPRRRRRHPRLGQRPRPRRRPDAAHRDRRPPARRQPGRTAAEVLFEWADEVATRVGSERGLDVQQIDSGAFKPTTTGSTAGLSRAGYTQVRRWWQMSRPVTPEEADLDPRARRGRGDPAGEARGRRMPDEDDLRTVHDISETSFADHFNSHGDLRRVRLPAPRGPCHRWNTGGSPSSSTRARSPSLAGTLVGAVREGEDGQARRQLHVEYLGVLQSARGRGVAEGAARHDHRRRRLPRPGPRGPRGRRDS